MHFRFGHGLAIAHRFRLALKEPALRRVRMCFCRELSIDTFPSGCNSINWMWHACPTFLGDVSCNYALINASRWCMAWTLIIMAVVPAMNWSPVVDVRESCLLCSCQYWSWKEAGPWHTHIGRTSVIVTVCNLWMSTTYVFALLYLVSDIINVIGRPLEPGFYLGLSRT